MAIPTQLKHVVRRLGRTPAFTVLTLVTLAVGIGANAAIFSVVQGVLLRPLPYPRPDELVGVWHTAPGVNITDLEAAPSLYFTYREQGRTFQDVGLWAERSVTVTGLAEPERVSAHPRDGRDAADPGRSTAAGAHLLGAGGQGGRRRRRSC